MKKLNEEVIEEIKTNPILFGAIADAIGAKPLSMPRILKDNSPKLQSYRALNVLKNHFKLKSSESLYATV